MKGRIRLSFYTGCELYIGVVWILLDLCILSPNLFHSKPSPSPSLPFLLLTFVRTSSHILITNPPMIQIKLPVRWKEEMWLKATSQTFQSWSFSLISTVDSEFALWNGDQSSWALILTNDQFNRTVVSYCRYALLFKVCIKPLPFYEWPRLVPAFSNCMKSEKGFHCYEKGWKARIACRLHFAWAVYRGRGTPEQREWPHQATPLRTTLNISASSCQSFELVQWASQFMSIYFMHLLARCVLRYQKSLREFWRLSSLV